MESAFRESDVIEIHIPDGVEKLCDECFCECESLSCVTFGESSSSKLIGEGVFRESGVHEMHIPDGVEELCDECFSECKSLSCVTFGKSSSLKLIGKGAFCGSGVCEIHNAIGAIEKARRQKPAQICRSTMALSIDSP